MLRSPSNPNLTTGNSFHNKSKQDLGKVFNQALLESDINTMKFIISKDSSIVNRKSSYGFYPLEYAVLKGKISLAKFLVDNGADTEIALDNSLTTANKKPITSLLQLAKEMENIEPTEYDINDVQQHVINLQNTLNIELTELEKLKKINHSSSLYLQNKIESSNKIIDSLHTEITQYQVILTKQSLYLKANEMVKVLKFYNPKAQEKVPIFQALLFSRNIQEINKALDDYPVLVNLPDVSNRLPLEWAMIWGDIKLVYLLLQRGANPSECSKEIISNTLKNKEIHEHLKPYISVDDEKKDSTPEKVSKSSRQNSAENKDKEKVKNSVFFKEGSSNYSTETNSFCPTVTILT